MEWSNEKVLSFLEILQTEPCLWDPKLKSFKNRSSQKEAWRRVKDLIPFEVTIEDMKKKKESLIGYYRTHVHKFKRSLKSAAGKDEVYTTNWFAFETMDSFLGDVYDSSCTLGTEFNDSEERSESKYDGNETSSHWSSEIEEVAQNIKIENISHPDENDSFQDCGRKRQLPDDSPPKMNEARSEMGKGFEFINEKEDEEYEIFGRLIACKLKKIRNPNTRDILMNDIHNLVFRKCMADRLEQQTLMQ